MLPALVVAAMLSGCFRYFPKVLKAHLLLERGVPAQVAQPLPVIPALYRDKGSNEKEEAAVCLSFLWYGSGVFFWGASLRGAWRLAHCLLLGRSRGGI